MLTRREFTRLAMAGAASQVVSPLLAQSGDRKIGYCIIGLGRISMDHFMPAVLSSKNSRITGLVSGHRDKALAQAAKYGVPESSIYTYENMDQFKNNPAIDAVYVALPNSMHAEYTIRSARAGKHVLCEKPMATSVADSLAMIKACKDANKKLMIAYRCHYEPTNLRAMQLIRDGRLGKIQAIESANGFKATPNQWRLDRKLAGGGPLMDMGVYSLNACRYLTGEEPSEIKAFSSVIDHDGRFDTVEENVSWTMKFPSGAVASCNTSYGATMNGFYRVHGSLGFLYAEPAFSYQGLHLTGQFADPAGGKPTILDEPNTDSDPSQFIAEADYFAGCVLEDKTLKTAGEEGLLDMQYMSRIYESSGLPAL
jgi:predicted dehydrogenase